MTLTVGSLCTGYSGAEMALALAGWQHELAFVADSDPAASKVLAYHHPDVPNLGDITRVDWAELGLAGDIDLLVAGFPCQDVSSAGKRRGIAPGTRSGLWLHVRDAIDILRPPLVLLENVRGLLSAKAHSDVEPCPWCLGERPDEPVLRALGAVLGDLADIGYDAVWYGVPAAAVGAPHLRWRVFVLAWPAADPPHFGHRDTGTEGVGGVPAATVRGGAQAGELTLLPTPAAADGERRSLTYVRGNPTLIGALLPTPNAALGRGTGTPSADTAERRMYTEGRRFLDDAVALLPTPTATPYGNNQSPSAGAAVRPSLDSLAANALLPTPTAAATPKSKRALTASSDNGRRSGGGQSSPPGLDEIALLMSGVRPDNLPPDEELPPRTRALVESLLPTPTVADARGSRNATAGRGGDASSEWNAGWSLSDIAYADRWGEYAPAIARWEQVVGRPAPDPTEPGTKGQPRLSPRFVEWMQGLPDGHVTAVPGISRNDALRLLGNGIVPLQGIAAVTQLAAIVATVTASEVAA